jgi:hypothetical protein
MAIPVMLAREGMGALMIERFRRSWALAKASWAVLRADRELLVFPLASFAALVAVTITFAVPVLVVGGGLVDLETGSVDAAGVALGFAFYVVAYTVMFFFNTGLVGAALIRLGGGDPTVADGLRIATSRLPAIVAYALIAATVGMVLRFISERAGIVGQIVIGVLGIAWSLLTFLVVPVLVVENVGPLAAIRRSGSLLRTTWGEQLIGSGGIGLVFGLAVVVVLIVGVALVGALFVVAPALGVAGIIALVLAVGGISLVGATLGGIYTASLYRYAITGEAGAFGADAMTAAFTTRKSGLRGMLGQSG